MRFSDIIGQEKTIEKLVTSVAHQRVSHAILLAGPEGSGKLALAIAFAQYISCQDKLDGDSCGTCPSCAKYSKLIHPDLHFVFPVFKKGSIKEPVSRLFLDDWRKMLKKGAYFSLNQWLSFIGVKNQQGMIYTFEAAEILRVIGLKTYESDYKVMIIWLPEKMHPAPANKLLKIIEEPPGKTLFLLVSEEPEMVLPTIRSRCQYIRIPSISSEKLSEALQSIESINKERSDNISHISRGNYITALSMIREDEKRKINLERFISLMRLAHKKDIQGLSDWTDDLAQAGRETQKEFLEYCQEMIRGNFMLNLGQDPAKLVYITEEEQQFSIKFHRFIHHGNAPLLFSDFVRAWSHISANVNSKIVLFDLAIGIIRHIRLTVSQANN